MFEKTRELEAYKLLIAKCAVGILIIDEQKVTRFINEAAQSIFADKAGEFIGKPVSFPFTPGESSESTIQRSDGKSINIEVKVAEVVWESKPAFLLTVQDITARKETEKEFRKMYRAITSSPIMVVITDTKGNIEYVNPKFTEVTGYTFAEVYGKNIGILKSGKTSSDVFRSMWESINWGKEWQGELINKKKNGEFYWENSYISPVKDLSGNNINFIAFKEDITKFKRIEEELIESEKKFSNAFQAAPSIFYINTLTEGRYIDVNEEFERVLKYRREEVIGRTLLELGILENPADRARIIQMLHEQSRVRDIEVKLKAKTGSVVVGLLSAEVIDVKGEKCLLTLVKDVTEHKRAEEERAVLASIVDSSDDAIIGKTLDGIITSWNRGAEKLYGYSAKEAVCQPINFLAPPDRPDEVPQILGRIKAGGRIEHFETIRITKDGKQKDVSLTISPIIDTTGNIIGASTIARDITERKQAEEALRTAQEQLVLITDVMAVGVIHCSRDGRYLWVSRAYAEWLNLLPGEIVGRPIPEVIGPTAYEAIRPHVERVLTGEKVEYEATVDIKGQGPRWINAIYTPTFDAAGSPDGWVAVVMDNTRRKKLEEELEKARELLAKGKSLGASQDV